MKLFVLTCIDEWLDIKDQQIFTTFLEASHQMTTDFDAVRKKLWQDDNPNYISIEECFGESATLVYGEGPQQYEWKIKEVEA